jgi:uncharacterized protein
MRKMLTGVLLVCVLSVFFAGGQAVMVPADEFTNDVQGEPGIYLELGDIAGECSDLNHDGWIVVDSMFFGVHEPEGGATGQSRRRGSVITEDLELVKELDKSSPKIADAVCKGKVFDSVTIEVISGTANPRLVVKYELKNVVLKSYWHYADMDEDVSTEDVFTMQFESITMTYTEYDYQGNPKGDTEWMYVNQE